ncbi:MAG: LacI family transcriptional regulator [Proteobacteria bacterium]|nr:LacI family transcriptional regulator [Pseudomonadota bacterium]MBU1449813.1 LacI family transcriptional regulator [Pseudomonadota bacterium]MBU2467572.1 LacI family transcriptional regulator [Pseudomonadota bacterium]MBU2517270.1 LacI family transcriptional regulator [Pseudomonadota bacterium]
MPKYPIKNVSKLTIKDIAELAGVSPSSISIVLNNKEGVSVKTRDRILKIIREFNYTPNQVARSLVQRRSHCIGMVIPNTYNYSVFPELAWGVEMVLKQHGYSLSLISTHDDSEIEAREIENAKARGIDGIIISSALLGTQNLPRLVKEGFPVISLLRRVYDCPLLEFVIVDHFKGGYMAAEHVIRMGHRRIGLLRGPSNLSPGLERYEGMLQAATDYGISLYPELLRQGPFSQEFGYEVTRDMLQMGPKRWPTAVVCGNDDMALGSFEAILDAGLEVGRDIAVVGFNNIKTTSLRRIEITTISQQSQEMSRLAAKRLVERIENSEQVSRPYQKVLEPELVIRKSCGYAPGKYLMDRPAIANLGRHEG